MILKNLLTGSGYHAVLTTEHAASSYRQPVVVITTGDLEGEAVDPLGWEIVELTGAERDALPPYWAAP
jgi:hypothetical protein